MIETNPVFLEKARQLEPRLIEKEIPVAKTVTFTKQDGKILCADAPDYHTRQLRRGDVVCLDFGAHLVGQVALKFGYAGSHPDAPAWLRLKFAERPCELFENAEEYHGWISMGWIQQEQVHIDVLPARLELPRRYAFRYLQIEVLDVSGKFALTLEDALCTARTSADDSRLAPFQGTEEDRELDRVACNTLRSCMQSVFEDGPKRDRRLWLGDLRMQALVNYETFRNYDLVKRCLYLFAGSTLPGGLVGACLFIEPEIEVDDTVMMDYALFFNATLLDYYKATGDLQTLRELAPTGWHQVELARQTFCNDLAQNVTMKDMSKPAPTMGWCFVDWNLQLNKQASTQGIYMYCVKAAAEIARILGENALAEEFDRDYAAKREAAEHFWDESLGLYVSGADRQISWASQVWLTLGGAAHGPQALEAVEHHPEAQIMITPYMYHNYIDALMAAGARDKALQVLRRYWGGMVSEGADTFWEMYNPANPNESPYGGTIVNSYCHAWSCAPAYFLRKYAE